jgi:hypothetical protein
VNKSPSVFPPVYPTVSRFSVSLKTSFNTEGLMARARAGESPTLLMPGTVVSPRDVRLRRDILIFSVAVNLVPKRFRDHISATEICQRTSGSKYITSAWKRPLFGLGNRGLGPVGLVWMGEI